MRFTIISRGAVGWASAVLASVLAVGAAASEPAKNATPQARVAEVERAFARTMADRDHAAFTTFLSEETVFLSGPAATRGKQAVAEQWKTYFEGPEPPFSWEPETVEVLDSGGLALSTGPVLNGEGVRIATFTSIWRQEEPGVWRIVFDRGTRHCE